MLRPPRPSKTSAPGAIALRITSHRPQKDRGFAISLLRAARNLGCRLCAHRGWRVTSPCARVVPVISGVIRVTGFSQAAGYNHTYRWYSWFPAPSSSSYEAPAACAVHILGRGWSILSASSIMVRDSTVNAGEKTLCRIAPKRHDSHVSPYKRTCVFSCIIAWPSRPSHIIVRGLRFSHFAGPRFRRRDTTFALLLGGF